MFHNKLQASTTVYRFRAKLQNILGLESKLEDLTKILIFISGYKIHIISKKFHTMIQDSFG